MMFVETALMHVLEALAPALLLLLLSVMLSEMYPTLGCLALAGAFVLGAARRSVWTALIVAIGAAMLNLAVLLSRWMSVGVQDAEFHAAASHLLALFGMICGAGWVLGRCVARLVRIAIPAQS
jgi:hypothetical protein